MSPIHLLQAIWAVLVLWYVLERLLVVKGRAVNAQAWRNPARAARDGWRALWDVAPVAWAFVAAVFCAHAATSLGRGIWSCAVSGWPQDLSSPCLRALVRVDPAAFVEAFRSGEYWASRWRELLDAAVAYPVFDVALQPGAAVLLLGVAWWAHKRDLVPRPDHPRPRARAILSFWLLGSGLAAYLAQALLASRQFDVEPSIARGFALLFGLYAVPVISGAAVGLLALLAAKVVLALPVEPDRLLAQWLDRLPRFAALCAVPGCAVALADWFLAGWQQAPHPNAPGLAAGLWIFTRLVWLLVLPGILRLALHAGRSKVALAEFPRLMKALPGGFAVMMLRSAAVLFPVLVSLGLLELLAPASGLIPGALTVLAQWCIAFMLMGGALLLHREIRAAIGDDR